MASINALAADCPSLQIVSRDDQQYVARREIYNDVVTTNPAGFAIPKNAQEVASIVKFASRTGAKISVRCGGHDLFGRSLVDDGIVIDIRALNHVTVDKEGGVAVVGGGIQSEKLSKALADHGCLTPCPNIASVGYVGFATTGGYGQTVHKFGFGVDHLLAAKIVDADGNIVDADDDVMKGIRGAGGNFGVVVEATIKIYPFSQIFAGVIIYESSDFKVSMNNVQDGMNALIANDDYPPELDVQPFVSFLNGNKLYGGWFMWAGPDIERGRKYLEKVKSFHPVAMNSVKAVSMTESLEAMAPYCPKSSHCNARAVSVRKITNKIYDLIVRACETMPEDPAAMLTWHEVRACSPSFDPRTALPSVFNARESHYVVEILANSVDKANYEAVSKWGLDLRDQLVHQAPEEIIDAQWLASTPTNELGTLEKLYGEDNAQFLRKLKAQRDPKGIFKYALPDLSI